MRRGEWRRSEEGGYTNIGDRALLRREYHHHARTRPVFERQLFDGSSSRNSPAPPCSSVLSFPIKNFLHGFGHHAQTFLVAVFSRHLGFLLSSLQSSIFLLSWVWCWKLFLSLSVGCTSSVPGCLVKIERGESLVVAKWSILQSSVSFSLCKNVCVLPSGYISLWKRLCPPVLDTRHVDHSPEFYSPPFLYNF